MSGADEDDKPTVVLDLNALKKQKLKQEEDLANIASELEFNIPPTVEEEAPVPQEGQTEEGPEGEYEEEEDYFEAEAFETYVEPTPAPPVVPKTQKKELFPVILFDFGSDFYQKSLSQFPKGFQYKIVKTLPELNQCLKTKTFQIVVLNYDVNPKAVNQLSAQIKAKMPLTKTMIMAKSISPEKAKIHAKTPSGASGYYQFPLEASKIEKEFLKIQSLVKKVS